MRLLKYTLIFSILINIYNLVKKTKSVFSGEAFKNIKFYEDEINTEEDKAELMNTQKYIIILEIFINIYIVSPLFNIFFNDRNRNIINISYYNFFIIMNNE